MERLLAAEGAPPNTDGRPVCYQQTAFLRLGRFVPSLGGAGRPDARAWLGLIGLAAIMLLCARRRASWRRTELVAIAGLGGMVSEAIVLLRFQAVSGSLYRDIGLLLTAFMLGLAAGAFGIDRAVAARGGVSRRWGAILLVAFAAWNGGLAASALTPIAPASAWSGESPADRRVDRIQEADPA